MRPTIPQGSRARSAADGAAVDAEAEVEVRAERVPTFRRIGLQGSRATQAVHRLMNRGMPVARRAAAHPVRHPVAAMRQRVADVESESAVAVVGPGPIAPAIRVHPAAIEIVHGPESWGNDLPRPLAGRGWYSLRSKQVGRASLAAAMKDRIRSR